jgi:rRNA maturation endonuclease Nob1
MGRINSNVMKICNNCKTKYADIPAEAAFCPECGIPFENVKSIPVGNPEAWREIPHVLTELEQILKKMR